MSVPVSAILERKGHEVATTSADTTVAQVADEMVERSIGALVVVDASGTVEGVISERDVVRGISRHGAEVLTRSVGEIMTREVTTCDPTTGTTELAETMTEGRMRHLPVIDDGRLAGIISIGDVVKSRIDELAMQTESLERYVTGTAY